VLDESYLPEHAPFRTSSAPPAGPATQPAVVYNPAQDSFWVIYAQRTSGVDPSSLFGRVVGIAGAGPDLNGFTVAQFAGDQVDPAAVFNSQDDQIGIVYASNSNGDFWVSLRRYQANPRQLLGG